MGSVSKAKRSSLLFKSIKYKLDKLNGCIESVKNEDKKEQIANVEISEIESKIINKIQSLKDIKKDSSGAKSYKMFILKRKIYRNKLRLQTIIKQIEKKLDEKFGGDEYRNFRLGGRLNTTRDKELSRDDVESTLSCLKDKLEEISEFYDNLKKEDYLSSIDSGLSKSIKFLYSISDNYKEYFESNLDFSESKIKNISSLCKEDDESKIFYGKTALDFLNSEPEKDNVRLKDIDRDFKDFLKDLEYEVPNWKLYSKLETESIFIKYARKTYDAVKTSYFPSTLIKLVDAMT